MPTSNKNSLLKQSKKRQKKQKTIIDMDNRSLEQSKGQRTRLMGKGNGKGTGIYATCSSSRFCMQ